MNPQTPKLKESLHKHLVGGLGYVGKLLDSRMFSCIKSYFTYSTKLQIPELSTAILEVFWRDFLPTAFRLRWFE